MTDGDIILALEERWVSRDELQRMLGSGDRGVRAYIADLNTRLKDYGKCILSTSSRKGYHIPNPMDEDDLELVRGAVEELKSKAISIFEHRQSLENFLRTAQEKAEQPRITQLTLF